MCSGIGRGEKEKEGLIFMILHFDESHLRQRGRQRDVRLERRSKAGLINRENKSK